MSRQACAKVRVGRRKYGLTESLNRVSWSSTGQLFFLFFFPRAGRTRPQSPHFSKFPKVSGGVLRIIQFGAVAGRMILFVVKTKDTMCLERLTSKSQNPSANRPLERLLHRAGPTVYCFFLCSRSLPLAGAKLDLRSRQLSMTGPFLSAEQPRAPPRPANKPGKIL